jgi:hypothetical protein
MEKNEHTMDAEQIISEYKTFQDANNGFGNLMILKTDGQILYSLEDIADEDAKGLMDAWLNHKSAVLIGENRYPILSWDELQFGARNVKGKGALVGTRTKQDHYVVAHLNADSRLPPSVAAINLNRWAWDLL